jgi:ribonuclease P protein component, eubacterial
MLAAHAVVQNSAHSFLPTEDFSFTHRDRLLNASQFTRVFDRATKSSSDFFTVLSRENAIGQARLGIVVAKRRAKRSVDRNIIKRIIRESFRLNKATLPANDFIVILKRPIKTIKRTKHKQSLSVQMNTLWKKY